MSAGDGGREERLALKIKTSKKTPDCNIAFNEISIDQHQTAIVSALGLDANNLQ